MAMLRVKRELQDSQQPEGVSQSRPRRLSPRPKKSDPQDLTAMLQHAADDVNQEEGIPATQPRTNEFFADSGPPSALPDEDVTVVL